MLFIGIPASLVRSQCDSSLLMENLDGGRRSPENAAPYTAAKLCDYQLDEGLYLTLCFVY